MPAKAKKQAERLIELYPGQALWKVPIDLFREQDRNARVMSKHVFERLTANIQENERLRSVPLAHLVQRGEDFEFPIISGHHRIRAARVAGVLEVFAMVEEGELSRDEILSEQLAQNALAGEDDPQVLAELYMAIEDLDERIRTGITDQDLELDALAPHPDEVELLLEAELLQVVFLPSHFERWEKLLDRLLPDAKIYVADYKDFDKVAATIRRVANTDNVRNVSAIMVRMVEIVEEALDARPKEEQK